MKVLLLFIQMVFVGEVEQKSDSIAVGDSIKTVSFTDPLVFIPKIVVMEASSEVEVQNVTKHSCDIKSSETGGVSFRISIVND